MPDESWVTGLLKKNVWVKQLKAQGNYDNKFFAEGETKGGTELSSKAKIDNDRNS